jgi:uncharacterized membrane protein YhaH (DUF805 family)
MGTLFSFYGRIGRGGFWLGLIAGIVAIAAAFAIAYLVFGMPFSATNADGTPLISGSPMPPDAKINYSVPGLIIVGIGYILGLWISLAAQVKRWHDRGASGWWVLINLIPGIGTLVSCGFLEGKPGPNRFGPDPRNATA